MPGQSAQPEAQRSSPATTGDRVKVILAGIATTDLSIVAGWTQSLQLRVVLIILITAVIGGTSVHLRRRRRRARLGKASSPRSLPQEVELPFFYGREEDLRTLENRHADSRQVAPDTASDRPTILAIYGPPGVGKTALARRLANRLAADYPDGQLDVSMGDEGQAREPREILLTLLGQLGWPEIEILGDTNIDAADLAAIFRGRIARQKILILLDAVHSQAQLRQVLPGTSSCTVITTSRANLKVSGQISRRLKRLTPEEATGILLKAYSNGGPVHVDSVAELIELCDYLPEALLAAGERARDEGLERTVQLLRDRERRLDALTYGGRNMANRIASEYNNLNDQEKKALLLLTVPASETFVPWVLQPLMDSSKIGSAQAANLMAKISRGGLLRVAGKDPSGFGRYRFTALARLFAEQCIRDGEIASQEMDDVRERFARAYFAGSMQVLARTDDQNVPAVPFHVPAYWYPEIPGWDRMVADNIDFWVRAEFGNLIRAVLDAASYGQTHSCWLLAQRAGDCFSPSASHSDVRRAFAEAANSAVRHSSLAEIKVGLARSGYLVAVHDYAEAIAELNHIAALAGTSGDQAAQAEALRRLGHAWQEIGDYTRASACLHEAAVFAEQAKPSESRLIALLLAENAALTQPEHWAAQLTCTGPEGNGDNGQFIEKMILSRAACRRRDAAACDGLLTDARQHCDGNLAHRLDVEHGQAAMMLHGPGNQADGSAAAGVLRSAVTTLRSADQLGRPYARVRAHCTLAQALVRSGQPDNCLHQIARAEPLLRSLPADEASGLTVTVERIRGEALLALGRFPDAAVALAAADRQVTERASWARGEILVLLGIARRELRDHPVAITAHATAVQIFRDHRDQAAAASAFGELCSTLRRAGLGRSHVRRMQRAFARESQSQLS